MESSTGFSMILLALAGMMILSKGETDTWKSQSVKMTETWPFVAFSSTAWADGTTICDAIIYNQKWLLISPTCPTRNATMFYFGVGNKWCDSGNPPFPYANTVQVRKLKRFISGWQDDFGFPWFVLGLVEVLPITFNDNVQPAKLAEEPPREGQKFDSPGWVGIEDESGCYVKYKASITMASEAECKETWGDRHEDGRGDLICFGPPRNLSTYPQFINDGAPVVKDGTVYGLMVVFGKSSGKSITGLSMGLQLSPLIPWLKAITNDRWYSILHKLIYRHYRCS